MLYPIVRYRNRFDNHPAAQQVSLEHLIAIKHEVRANKDGAAFSPVQLVTDMTGFRIDGYEFDKKDTQKKKAQVWKNDAGARIITDLEDNVLRRNENIHFISMAVLDFDKGITPEVVREKLTDLNYWMYSTHSHTKEAPRFRVVLPFKEPLTLEQFRSGWPFGFESQDVSCKDFARLFYLPACPKEHQAEAFSWSQIDKKLFAPKLEKKSKSAAKEEKAPKPKKKRLMDYKSLDAVSWFTVHGAYQQPADGGGLKHWVLCPWAHNHTDGKAGPTDAVLWTEPGKWPTFACSHSHCKEHDIKSVIALWGDADSFCSKELSYKDLQSKTVVRCLGFDEDGRYYYQCNLTAHIVALRASEHKELQFYSITADLDYWYKEFGDEETGRVSWKTAAAAMMGKCHAKGFFRLDKVRGGGVWEDSGRVVAHLGRHVQVDGKRVPLSEFKSEYTYEAAVHEVDLPPAIDREAAMKVLEIALQLPLSKPDAFLLAGMVPIGMLSGILEWRPHLWLTGDQASGKTSILTYFLNPLWFPISGLSVSEGKTTDAGIRQKLKRSAFPVIVDESEADSKNDAERIDGIVTLARSSSSVSDGRVLKGTVSGHGMEFVVRSTFVLCSIASSLDKPQDKQRFTGINVTKLPHHEENWPTLKAAMKETLNRDFALGLYARVIDQAENILHNVKVMQQAVMAHVKGADARYGEQIGTLMAGAYSLIADGMATLEQANWLLGQLGPLFEREVDKNDSNVPLNTLQTMFSHIIREDGKAQSILELVYRASRGDNYTDQSYAKAILMRHGMRVDLNKEFKPVLSVSSNHPQARAMFREYGVSGHHGLLALLPKAKKVLKRFGSLVGVAVEIPLSEYLEPANGEIQELIPAF